MNTAPPPSHQRDKQMSTAKQLAEESPIRHLPIPSNPLPMLKGLTEEYFFTYVNDQGRDNGIISYYSITLLAKVFKDYPHKIKDKQGVTLQQLKKVAKALEKALKIKNSISWELLDKLEPIIYTPEIGNTEVLTFTNGYVQAYFILTPGAREVKERLHKQPRNLLKTVAQTIGNNTTSPGLFSLPQNTDTTETLASQVKEEISKNAAALAFLLVQKYQENNNKPLEITNLNDLAEVLGCNNYRLKLYLLHLGGYLYPIIDIDETTKELVFSNEQLFSIQFRYSPRLAEKYLIQHGEAQGVERIGNKLLSFIKEEPIDRIIVQPNQRFINALAGKGLGNILTVDNKFVGLILEITDIATKILSYSSSNKSPYKIREDNLIKHLGLEKQVKTQGRPRVRETILKGLQELQDKGHIKNYSYDIDKRMYSYTYSDKYVKFKETKRAEKTPQEGVQ